MTMRCLLAIAVLIGHCHAAMILMSPEFRDYGLIPGDFGCDIITGEERDPFKPSPPLAWFRPPAKTRSYVLLVDDIDADGFVHWLVANIPPEVTSFETDASHVAMPDGVVEYPNSYGGLGWGGPCPYGERHRYRFRMFALNVPEVNISMPTDVASIRAADVQAQLDPYTIYVAVLAGDYECPAYHKPLEIPPPPVPYVPPLRDVPPVEIRRYFKPSESFKKKGKHTGVYDSVKAKCERGELHAQLCKYIEKEPRPDVLVPSEFPMKKLWYGTTRSVSTDEASALSAAEEHARHVRPGGLQPINTKSDFSLEVPEQPNPQATLSEMFKDVTAGMLGGMTARDILNQPSVDPMVHLELDSGLHGDIKVLDQATEAANSAVGDLTQKLEDKAAGCDGCRSREGYIPPSERKYSLTLRSPIFIDCNITDIPTSFGCDPLNPFSRRPSIPFVWKHAPAKTRSFVLMMDDVTDEDEGDYGYVHWLVTDIPAGETNLASGASNGDLLPSGAKEQPNSFGTAGYFAPCAKDDRKRTYRVRLFALATETSELKLTTSYKSKAIDDQLRPLVTASLELTYTRPAFAKADVMMVKTTDSAAPAPVARGAGAANSKSVATGPPSGPSFFAGGMDEMMNGRH
jgi:Raf kinase inhibitor-like YbhB/YbcL family protein